MKILHIIHDSHFFVFLDELFKSYPSIFNRYLVLVSDEKVPLKYINNLDIFRVVKNDSYYQEMSEDLAWCDCLIIHYFSSMGARMIRKAPPNITVVWSGWGADYYNYINPGQDSLLEENTRALVHSIRHRGFFSMVNFGRDMLRKLKHSLIKEFIFIPAINRVDLFSSPIPEDYDLLLSALGRTLRANYVQLNYGSLEKTFLPGGCELTGQDILIGNSATATNNHIEIFRLLSKQDLGNRNVIVPLSYGDEKYKDAVILVGKKLLGNHFEPILDLMPLVDYNNYIGRCSVVIMNQFRQQALGNIGTMLFKGARVYLNEKNPLYHFFNKRGAHIFSTKSLLTTKISTLDKLSNEQVEQNKRVIESFWGSDSVIKNVSRFIKKVEHKQEPR